MVLQRNSVSPSLASSIPQQCTGIFPWLSFPLHDRASNRSLHWHINFHTPLTSSCMNINSHNRITLYGNQPSHLHHLVCISTLTFKLSCIHINSHIFIIVCAHQLSHLHHLVSTSTITFTSPCMHINSHIYIIWYAYKLSHLHDLVCTSTLIFT